VSKNDDLSSPPGLGRAAEKAVDVLKNFVDIRILGPKKLIAKAHADAEIAVIEAEAQQAVLNLEQQGELERAKARLLTREVRRQKNIETIAQKSILALPAPNAVSSDNVEEDWLVNFFERAQDISNENMQRVLAKILAGEISAPKSFTQ
jgi:hypothetical protein